MNSGIDATLNQAAIAPATPAGPCLVRRPSHSSEPWAVTTGQRSAVSDDVYLAAYAATEGMSGFSRKALSAGPLYLRREWKMAAFSAVAGITLALGFVAFFRSPEPISASAANITVTAPPLDLSQPTVAPSPLPLAQPTPNPGSANKHTAPASDKLIARNRRLEALVEVLRERRKARSETRLSHISTN